MALKRRSEKSDKSEKAAKKKPAKSKTGKFLPGSRFVLFIGDEGTILLYMRDHVVLSRQFVPDASEQNLEELRTSLNEDTKAPLSIAIDSSDQSFVQQSLPPVSSMSVKKLIKRRLDRDFGANDIKGAILLGREDTGRKDWNFLMVSLESGRQLGMWLDFVFSLPNRFQGIYLVSVETEVIVKNLERAMGVSKSGTGSKWKFFVSHNKVGGFRQVVLMNGRIIFTRMAQPIGESTPEVIAGNIEQEMQSTIEYMKRLSYKPADGLDVYILAASAIKPAIDKSKIKANSFNILTPYEVAQYLRIEGATQPTDQFGDVVLAASICSSPQHVLTLSTPESKKFDNLYAIYRAQRAIAALIIIGMIGYAGGVASDIYLRFTEAEELELAKKQHQQSFDNLRAEIKRTNLDVDKVSDMIDLYQLLQKQKVSPLQFIAKVETVIKPPIIVKGLEWSVEDKTSTGISSAKPKVAAVLTLEFPGVTDLETWRIVSRQVLTDLKELFKGYDISFTKLPSKFSETEKLDLNFEGAASKPAPSNVSPEVQLTMKEGP